MEQQTERLFDLEVTAHGTILEELEVVHPTTGIRLRLLVEHLADGSFRTLELRPAASAVGREGGGAP